jgi:hypothetical protein
MQQSVLHTVPAREEAVEVPFCHSGGHEREGGGSTASEREMERHAKRGRTGCRQTDKDSLDAHVAEDAFPQSLDVGIVECKLGLIIRGAVTRAVQDAARVLGKLASCRPPCEAAGPA